jgi:hypothetical protein
MRKLDSYVRKYGPVAGPKLYHALQSQAAHAGVSARLRRKIEALKGKPTESVRGMVDQPDHRPTEVQQTLPLFGEEEKAVAETVTAMAVGA